MPDHDNQPIPLLFDVNHAALLLGVCVKTLRRETMIGRMPCARVGPGGRAIRYSLDHVREYIRRCDDDGRAA